MNAESPRRFSVLRGVFAALFALIVLCSATIGVFYALRARENLQGVQRVTLADGTKIEFVGTAVGGQTFSSETPWLKRARRFLPVSLQRRWLPNEFTADCGYGSNSLTVYF